MNEQRTETPQLIVAVAVFEFAERWDRKLCLLANKVACHCEPRRESIDESEHDPECPVGVLRQAGRLMCEEAGEKFAAARA